MTFTVLLAAEIFPAASFAFTVKLYAVAGESPVTEYVVAVVVDPRRLVPLYTSYPVTATLSVDPLHDNDVEFCVVEDADS